jgi:SAM-dependent methyltransferase
VFPLLQGRVKEGVILQQAPNASAGVSGTVLEIGPGSGQWVSIFSDRYLSSTSTSSTTAVDSGANDQGIHPRHRRVTHVYGVEPNVGVHPLLRAKIAQAGLEDVYEIVPCGIEALWQSGAVQRESVDCIVGVLCLCSIPDPERNIRELYGYLKPGGRWFVYEHVRCPYEKSGRVMVAYHGMLMFILSCHLCWWLC